MKESVSKRSGTEVVLMAVSGLLWASIIVGSYAYAYIQTNDNPNQVALVLPNP